MYYKILLINQTLVLKLIFRVSYQLNPQSYPQKFSKFAYFYVNLQNFIFIKYNKILCHYLSIKEKPDLGLGRNHL